MMYWQYCRLANKSYTNNVARKNRQEPNVAWHTLARETSFYYSSTVVKDVKGEWEEAIPLKFWLNFVGSYELNYRSGPD